MTEQMNTQSPLEKITTASSLIGLAAGFLVLGVQILSRINGERIPIVGGAAGILLGATFLTLAVLYGRYVMFRRMVRQETIGEELERMIEHDRKKNQT
jgi:hypothetical protein